ncbi:hypothetical protein ACFY00_34335 [Kitasatospora sp. NPDC001540]|uniref:hypothetical protein n=1 Tax=Kitasatospora sp. NPDC001540 TaxID=3364014 RepID=UPI0036850205
MELETLEEQETVADVLEDVLRAVGCPIAIHVSGRGFSIDPDGKSRLLTWAHQHAAA